MKSKAVVYLSSPRTQQQAEHLEGMSVLLSYATWSPWIRAYLPAFRTFIIDSGAFSAFNSGTVIDREKYFRWSLRFHNVASAIACLDSIKGDTDETIDNCRFMPDHMGFPTFHESDPWDALPEMVELAYRHGKWLGLGLIPPRAGKGDWVRKALSMIPDDIHIHGWACREYLYLPRIDSTDSTNWFLDAMALARDLPWLNYGECLGLIIKRYQRQAMMLEDDTIAPDPTLWGIHDRNLYEGENPKGFEIEEER